MRCVIFWRGGNRNDAERRATLFQHEFSSRESWRLVLGAANLIDVPERRKSLPLTFPPARNRVVASVERLSPIVPPVHRIPNRLGTIDLHCERTLVPEGPLALGAVELIGVSERRKSLPLTFPPVRNRVVASVERLSSIVPAVQRYTIDWGQSIYTSTKDYGLLGDSISARWT